MRLNRLDLTRYGKFTDHSIDFGEKTAGSPDFHIVYGLNEAGKSTTFAAFLDLLFGIPERSGYNFLHPYNAMRIGGQLAFDGSQHELVRLKQRSGSLIDGQGSAINEALLTGALGGISRDAYRTMFSLDDQSLKDGGNAIIQSKGELGELLFSASSGLAGLSKSLSAASDEAASVYKKRSSSTRLAELKRALETLKAERNAIDTFAAAHATLTSTYQQARTAYDAAASDLAQAKTRHAGLTRILGTLPLSAELARLAWDPANQTDHVRPPAEWFALLPQLSRDETRLQALLGAADGVIEQLAVEIDAIAPDEPGLAIGAHVEMLDNGRARYRAAESDLPKRRQAFAEQDGMLARLLADLELAGHTDPETLLLPASTTGIIRELIEKRSGIDAERAAAERELKRSRSTLERLNEEASSATEDHGALDDRTAGRLQALLARFAGSDLSSRLSVEERARQQLQRSLDNCIAKLAPWDGDMAALEASKTADLRQIETWRSQATAIERRISEHRDRHRTLVTEQVENQAKLAALSAGGSIDDAEAFNLRSERDTAWQTHLGALDLSTAKLFEETMRRDDTLSASRLSRARELAEVRQLTQAAAMSAAAIERQQLLLDEAQTESVALAEKIGALMPDDIADGATETLERLSGLESWTNRRADVLAAWDDLQRTETTLGELRAEIRDYQTEIETLLTAVDVDGCDGLPIGDLVHLATDILAQNQNRALTRANHEKSAADLARDLAEREREMQAAETAADAWTLAWQETLSATWLADKSGSVAAVREILDVLSKLPGILKERREMAQRVAAMEHDQAQFRQDLGSLLGKLGETADSDDPLGLAGLLLDRHKAALRSREVFEDKRAELERLTADRAKLAADLAVHNARKAELTSYFGTDTLTAVAGFLDEAKERDRAQGRMEELKGQIAQGLRLPTYDEAEQVLRDIDADDVERQAMEFSTRIDDLTERARELYAEMTRASDKLDAVGGDDAVARIEAKRRTVFLEIEDLAGRYLTLRAGILAAERALHIYREKHRSSMMNRASEAFRLITGGNYSGLATQIDKDKEILIGVARDGGSKLAETMSTGTQFQLYLALRLAGYEEFAAVRPAVPFIADDIMESFDDPRSEEVFRLLGEMSKVGQVIYLTHHWHLCEIARTIVPEVKIHRLP